MKILNSIPYIYSGSQNRDFTFFETIKIENSIFNLEYHQKRVDDTYKNFFKTKSKLNLKKVLSNYPKDNFFRAKVIYNIDGLVDVEFFCYRPKKIKTAILIEAPDFEYNFKYLNRDFFNNLYKTFSVDEFIITKNGFITDSTIANIAFFSDKINRWITPKEPLLQGTTLNRYLTQEKLIKKKIHYKDLKQFKKIAFLNAMIDFKIYNLEV